MFSASICVSNTAFCHPHWITIIDIDFLINWPNQFQLHIYFFKLMENISELILEFNIFVSWSWSLGHATNLSSTVGWCVVMLNGSINDGLMFCHRTVITNKIGHNYCVISMTDHIDVSKSSSLISQTLAKVGNISKTWFKRILFIYTNIKNNLWYISTFNCKRTHLITICTVSSCLFLHFR